MKKSLEKISKSIYWKIFYGLFGLALVVLFGLPSLINFLQTREPVDISGEWRINFKVNDSTYRPYIGMESDYKVFLNQKNQALTGQGESWEFDAPINYKSHHPIKLEGKIQGRKIIVNYTLIGSERTTVGSLVANVDLAGEKINGEFKGTGADVSGELTGKKL